METDTNSSPTVASFVSELPAKEKADLELELGTFVVKHASHHRPIALVSSGGTAADLEVNSVRSLDNFSTGLRGAVSAEEFLRRGYAVIHLWRRGSAAPYARVLSQLLGLSQANHGLSVDSLGKLFSGGGDENDDDYLVQQVLSQEADPWLTDSTTIRPTTSSDHHQPTNNGQLSLHRHLFYSTKLQKAMKERSEALKEGRLLVVPFRTIEEYLAKLQLSAEALRDSKSLALFYLAAAVSDYYIPREEKSQHKIQSQEGGNEMGIRLQLHPVPKTMGLLKHTWAPESYVVGFKLETDTTILRRKAEKSVQKYGCHMVIGNILATRHSKVWILSPPSADASGNVQTDNVPEWPFQEITKSHQHHAAGDAQDSLECAIIDFVVQAHFEYISSQGFYGSTGDGIETAKRRQADLREKKRQFQRQALVKHVQDHAATIAGAVIAVLISSTISSVLQQRASNSGRR